MSRLKSSLLLFSVVSMVILSCGSNPPTVNESGLTDTPSTKLTTATSTFAPEATVMPVIALTSRPMAIINLSPELYLDENSSPDNLRGEPYRSNNEYFSNGDGNGLVYHFGNEEWVTALTWTRTLPFVDFDETPEPDEELRQHYVQVWKDGQILYSFPVDGIGSEPERLLRYHDHWIFWFMNINTNLGQIVQDGISLNDLHDYDSAFSVFLLDGKPFFFFQRGNQLGVSFDNEEILLPYSNISYGPVCCDGGGAGHWNPRGTDIMVGFYTKENSEYRYIEIGLRQ